MSKAQAKKHLKKHQLNYGSVHLDIDDPKQHWDYAIAFPGEPIQIKTSEQKSMEEILQHLYDAGLQVRLFHSSSKTIIFAQIRCHYNRLKAEADSTDFPVLLDPIELEALATTGIKLENSDIKPFAITDVKQLYDYHPYEYIHAAYEDTPELQHLFAKRNLDGSIFTPMERMKLIESIMTSTTELKLDALVANGSILAYYPLHNTDEIKLLAKKWIPWFAAPWKQPLDDIRDYFGERIAFYFGYLGHYTTWLVYASVVSLVVFMLQVVHRPSQVDIKTTQDGINKTIQSENPYIMTYTVPIYALFMCIWSTLFIESWKRQQSVLAMKWGMATVEETPRQQFEGEPVLSAITGVTTKYFPATKKMQRVAISWFLLLVLCSIVLLIVAGIYRLRYLLVVEHELINVNRIVASVICSFANVVQIIIMGKIYYRSFYRLNEYENHETDSQYESSLARKTFVFQFINNFAGLMYIAFLKNYFEGDSQERLHELALSLGIVFCSQLVIGNIREIALPRLWVKLAKMKLVASHTTGIQIAAEDEFFLATYEWSGTFDDFTEIVVQFGFCTLFVVAFPLTPFFSLINNYFEIRVDGFRLLYENRRSRPRSASSIGIWLEIVEFMATLAILTNAYVVVWTSNTFDYVEFQHQDEPNYVQLYRYQAFTLFVAVLLAFRFFIAQLIPNTPDSVVAQIKRQLFFNNKAIYRIPDNTVETFEHAPGDVLDLTIRPPVGGYERI